MTTISTTLGARNGMLVRNAEATETARRLDVVIFDKTGTLNKGEFGVTDLLSLADWDEATLLSRVGSFSVNGGTGRITVAGDSSEHHLAQGGDAGIYRRS